MLSQNSTILGTENGTVIDPSVENEVGYGFTIFTGIFLVFLSITGILTNCVVLYAFFTHRSLRTKANYFIASLSISDLISSIILIPFDAEVMLRHYTWNHGPVVCDFVTTLFYLVIPSSILNLFGASLFRYITIAYPYHSKYFRLHYIMAFIIGLWLYSLVTALLPVLGWRPEVINIEMQCVFAFDPAWSLFVLICNFFVPSFLMMVMYMLIFRIANRHVKEIEKISRPESVRRRPSIQPRLKAARKLCLLVGGYLVCWSPYMILLLCYHICFLCMLSIPREVPVLFIILTYVNASMNPILFSLLCPEFRSIIRQMTRKPFLTMSQLHISGETTTKF